MTRTERIPIVVTSAVGAQANGSPIHVDSNMLALQIISSPAALAQLEGSLDRVNWVDMNYDNAAGAYTLTVMNTLGAGYYKVHERPKYVRFAVAADAGGPRDWYAVLIVKKESD